MVLDSDLAELPEDAQFAAFGGLAALAVGDYVLYRTRAEDATRRRAIRWYRSARKAKQGKRVKQARKAKRAATRDEREDESDPESDSAR
ncbi:hypothetical protein ACFQE1_07465 [Halobium palmae]|uniref:Uncharacterized protein n=1 Tax=Halobium palmae TaxID=1776492 RepID=A0ABD5RZ50_9EURY